MNMLFILIFFSLIFLSLGVYIFFWAIRSRQFKEMEVQAYSILNDDEFEGRDIETDEIDGQDCEETKIN